jgi:hypothetical protein
MDMGKILTKKSKNRLTASNVFMALAISLYIVSIIMMLFSCVFQSDIPNNIGAIALIAGACSSVVMTVV